MHGVRQWWVRLSILHKAIVLSCAFVIPILLVVGLLMNDFYDYREKSDDILSEYARCTDYMNAMEQENALLGELTFAAPESDTIDKYADAVQDTASAWERLRSAETDGSTQSEVLKQVIDRTMKSYRVRQETFIAQLHDGTFDAVNYEALRTQGSYLTQYTDQLTAAFLMEGREGYLVLGQRGTSQNMVFTIVAAIGSVLFAGAMLYYARSLLLPVQQMSRGARRVADGEYDIEDFNFARSDEIGMLADSFNHLSTRLRGRFTHWKAKHSWKNPCVSRRASSTPAAADRAEPLCATAEPDQPAFSVQHAAERGQHGRNRAGDRHRRHGGAAGELLPLHARP
ncbi:MAG: HAMP domain-containing protein [Butyricicoccus sp.]